MIAKVELSDKQMFNNIKEALNRNSYVECGLCGAVRVEAKELARVLHALVDHDENLDDMTNEHILDFLWQIIEPEPDEFKSYEEYEKWLTVNEKYAYDFLAEHGYSSRMYGKYEDIVVFGNPACSCFGKDKITKNVVFD